MEPARVLRCDFSQPVSSQDGSRLTALCFRNTEPFVLNTSQCSPSCMLVAPLHCYVSTWMLLGSFLPPPCVYRFKLLLLRSKYLLREKAPSTISSFKFGSSLSLWASICASYFFLDPEDPFTSLSFSRYCIPACGWQLFEKLSAMLGLGPHPFY